MKNSISVGKVAQVESRILMIRGEKVIIDADLAEFYNIPTGQLNQQVKRNKSRFPDDFVFRLTKEEKALVIQACPHLDKLKHTRSYPNAFTEHGAIMAATVLKSEQAVEMSIFIVRAFVKLREVAVSQKEIAKIIKAIDLKLAKHDEQIGSLVRAIRQLISPKLVPKKRRIGFNTKDGKEK